MAPTPRGLGANAATPLAPAMRSMQQIDFEARVIAHCYIVAEQHSASGNYLDQKLNRLIGLMWTLSPSATWQEAASAAEALIAELKDDTP